MENAAMVEENGTGGSLGDQMNQSQDPHNNSSSSSGGPPGHPVSRGPPNGSSSSSSTGPSSSESAAAAAANIVQILPASHTSGSVQAQSVIQQNQQSVIQTAAGQMPALPRGVLLVCNKPSSVIHTTQGSLQAIQIKPEPHIGSGGSGIMTDTNSDDTMSDDESSPKKRRDLLTRRPSYRKILSDLGGAEIANAQGDGPGLHAIAASGGGVVQYTQAQDGQIYVPLMGGNVQLEDQSRKREMRLQKNREAARECRRKKKEYIKCLENRVAVLENQNKALIEELKSLKELYCQQKND